MSSRSRILIAGLDNNRGGTENVINNYVGALSDDLAFDFLVYEEPWYESSRLGDNRFFVIPRKQKDLWGFKRGLGRFFEDHADEYHTLWMNFNNLSNIDALVAAARRGVPRRIAHVHSASYAGGFPQQVLSTLHRRKYGRYVTDRWACSKKAGAFFFGQNSFEVVPNAIDYGKFIFSPSARDAIRFSLGVGDGLLLGTVGRLDKTKNQSYLISLTAHMRTTRPDVQLLIVGEGPCESELRREAGDLGIEDAVYFVGAQSDIGAYLSALDVFLFPSFFEGLGLSLIEAQVNGLPCIVSEGISPEATISSAVEMVPLEDAEQWCLSALRAARPAENSLSHRYDLGFQKQELLRRLAPSLS